jgi:arylsulfatase A-like enzyme
MKTGHGVGFVVLRLVFTAFCLLTSFYCLLAYLPFTYQQMIEGKVVAWPGVFAQLHPWLFWIGFACGAWTLARDCRPGTRGRVAGFVASGVISGIVLTCSPLLAGIRNEFRSLVWAAVWLVPLWWIAAIDLAGPGRRLTWRAADDGEDARLFWTSLLCGLAVALTYAGIYQIRFGAPGGGPGHQSLVPGVLAWSVMLHVLAFLALFVGLALIRGIASVCARPSLVEFILVGLAGAALLVSAIRTVIFSAVSLMGTPGLVMASAYAATLVVVAAGASVSLWDERVPVTSGVELAVRPLNLPPRTPRVVRMALLAVWVVLAYVLATSTAVMDWNYLIQTLAVLAVWLIGFVWIYGAVPRRGSPSTAGTPMLVMLPAVLLVGFRLLAATPGSLASLGVGPENRTARFDRYAGYDVSFRVLHNLVRAEPGPAGAERVQMGEFYALLQRHTNIPRTVTIAVPDLHIVPQIMPATARKPHIFIVVIDSLRQDYLSPYNSAVTFTPAIGQFARESGTTVFRNAFTRYGATGLSEPAIWTGAMVPHQQYPSPFGQANTLQKLVRGLGYQAHVSVDTALLAVLAPWPELIELDKGVANRNYDLGRSLEELEGRLRARPPSDTAPLFAYTQPQNIHVSVITREGNTVPAGESYPGFYPPYASRVRRVDEAFGRFLDALRELGLYGDSIVILMSDHGDSLGEDGRFGHAYTIYPEILRIPIVVHLPTWLRGLSVDPDGVAMSTDITPSVYYLLGQRQTINDPLFGRPLFTERADERRAYARADFVVASSYGPVYGVLSGDGTSLYIADATSYRDYSYDLTTGTAGRPRPVTAAVRNDGARRIRDTIERVATLYRVPRDR